MKYIIENYEDFLSAVTERLSEKMGAEYEIKLHRILKNNDVSLDGVLIKKEHTQIAPNIYLNSYYHEYMDGKEFESVIDCIISVYENNTNITIDDGCRWFDFDEIKDRIFYKLVNKEWNIKLLQTVPYKDYLDFAIVYHFIVKSDNDEVGTVMINNEHCLSWGVTQEMLHEIASSNTPRIFPALLRPMSDVMRDMMRSEIVNSDECAGLDSTEIEQMTTDMLRTSIGDGIVDGNDMKMYVLSNTRGINGAACMLYPKVLEEAQMKLKGDYYILPSSIHELILVPTDALYDERLSAMVKDINETMVPSTDVLSDNVYMYREKKVFQASA